MPDHAVSLAYIADSRFDYISSPGVRAGVRLEESRIGENMVENPKPRLR